jgi:hypothetical protein
LRFARIVPLLALVFAAGGVRAELASNTTRDHVVRIAVLGDSLAEGLWASLYRHFIHDRHVKVIDLATASTGFNATPYTLEVLDQLRRHPIDLLIVQAGANDRQRVLSLDRRHTAYFGTGRWFELYGTRLAYFLGTVQQHHIPVLWVGLPVMRDDAFDRGMRVIAAVQRDYAVAHGAIYLDIAGITAGKDGGFVEFKRGPRGRWRHFRHADGVHFWEFGYDLVARHVAAAIRKDFPGLLPTQ